MESCRLRGLPIYGRAVTTDVGLAFTFEEWNLWDDMDAWREATVGTVAERLAKLSDPDRRPALRESESVAVTCPIVDIVLLETESPQYRRYAETRVGDIAADVIVYDLNSLAIGPSEKVHDMPAGEWRRVQRASGYHYVLVNGEVTIQEDKETGSSPGRLLRDN